MEAHETGPAPLSWMLWSEPNHKKVITLNNRLTCSCNHKVYHDKLTMYFLNFILIIHKYSKYRGMVNSKIGWENPIAHDHCHFLRAPHCSRSTPTHSFVFIVVTSTRWRRPQSSCRYRRPRRRAPRPCRRVAVAVACRGILLNLLLPSFLTACCPRRLNPSQIVDDRNLPTTHSLNFFTLSWNFWGNEAGVIRLRLSAVWLSVNYKNKHT